MSKKATVRLGIVFYFPSGRQTFRVLLGPSHRAIIEAAERIQQKLGAVAFRIESAEPAKMDPRSIRHRVRRFVTRRRLDPPILRIGVGRLPKGSKPHGYLGRHVLDLGDRHAHAIVDIPWNALKTTATSIRGRFDPWRRAIPGRSARLLAIWNPHPTDQGDKAIIESHVQVAKSAYDALKRSGEFDVLSGGVLARRGRKKKATNIFVSKP